LTRIIGLMGAWCYCLKLGARAAHADRIQTCMNLALGSALACIGLTVPVVGLAAIAFALPLVLGWGQRI
jgi:Ca2+/H+ antiporter